MRSLAPSARPSTHTPRARQVLAVAVLAVAGLVATAATASAETTHVIALVRTVDDVLNNIRNWLMGILALLATVFVTIGGVRHVLAGGDPSEVERAKQAFKSAGFGYALAALAPLVVQILRGIVGA